MPNPSLEHAACDLVRRLGGRPHGSGGMCLCPAHEDHDPSLSIRAGHSSLLFKCFAGCTVEEIFRALRRLDLPVPVQQSAERPVRSRREDRLADVARQLFAAATGLRGTPGELYLQTRGIYNLSPALRWHPRTPLGAGRYVRFRPALLAAVEEAGAVVAVQRLFLRPGEADLAEDLGKPKRTLGRPLSGAVRLTPAGRLLGLAEGIESAASASILLGLPVWAVLGGERLHRIAIPSCVETLLLLPDNDRVGHRAEHRAREAYRDQSFHLETQWPWDGLNDWNDVLRRREGGFAPKRSAA